MESYFEFNVSYEGRHYFATAPRSFPACQVSKAQWFYSDLCKRFPESEGFHVTVTAWECTGSPMTLQWIKGGH